MNKKTYFSTTLNRLVIIPVLLITNLSFSQKPSFDCKQLLQKHQESNRLLRYGSEKSESYFFEAYCGCLQTTGDTNRLNKIKKYYSLSAFSGGLAMAKTFWYSALIDSNFVEVYKIDDLSANYIGFGYYTLETYGYQTLYNQSGKFTNTPKKYKTIKTIQSRKNGVVYFVGQTGLICDLFSADGTIIKTWDSVNKNEVLTSGLLLIYQFQAATSDYDITPDKIAIYTADAQELVPLSAGKLIMPEQWYLFITEQKTAYIFDTDGNLTHKKEGVLYRDSKSDFLMIAKQGGKNYYYDNERNTFDTLVRNAALSSYGVTVSIHPTNDKAFVLRDATKKSIFSQPVKLIEHLKDEWFLIADGTGSFFWNAKTSKKHPKPATYSEALQLNKMYSNTVDFTVYPFLTKEINAFDDNLQRIQSKYLQLFVSSNYDAAGNPTGIKSEVYKLKFSDSRIVVENGYCKNYNQFNQLVDSFPADYVFELHRNNLLMFKNIPDFIPFGYSLNGKKGLFYLGKNLHTAPAYDALSAEKNRIFSFTATVNNKIGVIGTAGNTIVPIDYDYLTYRENSIVEAHKKSDENASLHSSSSYSLVGSFDPIIDAYCQFIPSTSKFRIVKTSCQTEENWMIHFNDEKQTKITFNHFLPAKGHGYIVDNPENDLSQFVNQDLKPVVPGSFFHYCILPSGIIFSGYTTNQTDFSTQFYSFSDGSLKSMEIIPVIDETNACQLIGTKGEDPVLIDQNGSVQKLEADLVYKDANLPGYLFYALKSSPEKWGLVEANGHKITTPLFDKVFNFEGEHAIVWIGNKRFYMNVNGRTFAF